MTSAIPHTHLPRFLGIGAQKAGTTWLHNILDQHPDLCMPKSKETHFFETEAHYSKGTNWYSGLFDHATSGQICGEVTPGYMYTAPPTNPKFIWQAGQREAIPARVHETLGGDVKLIVMLRNPVDRAISAFVHHMAKGRIEPNLDNVQTDFLRMGIAHIGFYASHLEHWFNVFARDRFSIHCLETAKQDRPSFHRDIFDFLEVPPLENVADSEVMQFFARTTRENGDVVVREAGNTKTSPLKAGMTLLRAKDIEVLQAYFREDVLRLQDLVQLDFSQWRSDFPDM